MFKGAKMYRWAWLRYQKILAFIEEKLGLHKQLEDIVDRWERKSLIHSVHLSPVPTFRREDVTHLRRMTEDDIILAEAGQQPQHSSRSDTGRPLERRRLGRFYRWQLRNRPKGPSEDYKELIASLCS